METERVTGYSDLTSLKVVFNKPGGKLLICVIVWKYSSENVYVKIPLLKEMFHKLKERVRVSKLGMSTDWFARLQEFSSDFRL